MYLVSLSVAGLMIIGPLLLTYRVLFTNVSLALETKWKLCFPTYPLSRAYLRFNQEWKYQRQQRKQSKRAQIRLPTGKICREVYFPCHDSFLLC
jgi:hypothetical protein